MSLLIAVGVIVAFIVLLIILITNRIKVAGPNEAFIITGRKGKPVTNATTGQISTDLSGQKVVMGASVFVIPFVQQLGVIDLSSRRITVRVPLAVSKIGVRVTLEGVAVVKIGGTEDMVRAAAQRFLDQQDAIEPFTQEVLAGVLRAIVGTLTVEEIIRDRAAFAAAVLAEAETSLTVQGLLLDTFQIQDVQAEGTYLEDLGRAEAASAKAIAEIAESQRRQEAEQARLAAEELIAQNQKAFDLQQAQIKAETDAAKAEAAAAGPLAEAQRQQEILTQQELVAQRQAALRERELDTEVRKPAEAARDAAEQEAQARRTAAIAAAEAEAEETRLRGEAERASREALAAAVRAEGESEAAVIAAKGEAEAGALQARAEAFQNYNQAAVIEMLVGVMPQVVAEAAAPIGNIDNLTVVGTDGAGSMVSTVTNTVAQGLALTKGITGIDFAELASGALTHRAETPGDETDYEEVEAEAPEDETAYEEAEA